MERPRSLSSGEHARRLISQQLDRLRETHPLVLADASPEPLHQFRVCLRRLRSLLSQFGPALVIPPRLSRAKIAAVARATGLCRDADVLREWLERHPLLPLSPQERQGRGSLLRQLKRRRRQAFDRLEGELRSDRYRNLQRHLERWCHSPRLTMLGEQSLMDWLPDWLMACSGTCFLHAGWFATDPAAPELHALRKAIKEVRYGLEALREELGQEGLNWIADLREVQSCLGSLHDQEVLRALLSSQKKGSDPQPPLPALSQVLAAERLQSWLRWEQLRGRLLAPARRRSLATLLHADPESR
ncbi:MAG: CHAD domain-containing protein [Cyanobium sp.]